MTFFMLFLEKIAKLGQFWTEIKSFKNNFFKEFQVPLLPFHKKNFEFFFFILNDVPKNPGQLLDSNLKTPCLLIIFFFQKREPS